MNVGVLGGTFDPIHIGHMAVAEEVLLRLGLSEVLFVPAGQPWLRRHSPVASAEHRVAMVRLAIAGKPYFRLSTIEVDRDGPSYSVDTVAELHHQFGAEAEISFILGWDSLAGLPRWREASRLVQMCRLVAVPRLGYQRPDTEVLATRIPGLLERVVLLDRPEIDISASEIRDRVARGLSIHQLVPESVADYIKEHRLYTSQ